jgi:holo-[acyl-carrier protein] synthase
MIIGTGIDIVEVERVKASIDKYGDTFLRHFLTEQEISELPEGNQRFQSCAGRWAAKEAVAKALGTGFGAECEWRDIHISNDKAGAPKVELTGTAAKTAKAKGIASIHISISHENKFACAMAVAEG